MKNIIVLVLVLVVIGVAGWFLNQQLNSNIGVNEKDVMLPVEPDGGIGDGAEPLSLESEREAQETIGTSVNNAPITAYHFGEGETEVLFVGGVHGSYSWNTSLLAYELIDYLEKNSELIPQNVTVTIIPALNPDGLALNLGTSDKFDSVDAKKLSETERIAGRFNANNVDLNRNFDCNWKSEGTWRNKSVSGGDEVFSEPEAIALRDYVEKVNPVAVVVWFSAEGKVYPSACGGNPDKDSVALANLFADKAGYEVEKKFNAYTITGDMVNWLASKNIPAISVLLTTHQDIEFDQNLAGVEAVLTSYAE